MKICVAHITDKRLVFRTYKMKRQPTEWKEIFANHIFNKVNIQNTFKNSYNSIVKKKNSDSKIGRALNRHFPKKTHRWPQHH